MILLIVIAVILITGVCLSIPKVRNSQPPRNQKESMSVAADLTGKKVLIVIAPEQFRDEEYQEPRRVFEEAGATVKVASKSVTEAHSASGLEVAVDLDVYDASAADYDAVAFVGGQGAAVYFNDQKVLELARSFYEQGKVIGAICIAPSILANARILDGKRATAFASEDQNLKEKGAIYTGEKVTVDGPSAGSGHGKIITANGPAAAEEFGKKIAEALTK